jgi:HAMP domain-containing protein
MDVYLCESESGAGRGVFSARDFQKRELVLPIIGIVLPYQTMYSIQFDWDRHLEVEPPARYLNHSCDPNLGVGRCGKEGIDFIALRDIRKGEEVAFDYAMTEYKHYPRQVQDGIRQSMVVSFIVAYIALFAMVYLISSVLTDPIIRLSDAAERVGEGDYEQDFSRLFQGRLPDEIDALAGNFAIMVSKVYQREQNLRRQVEALKIEIDDARRGVQVSEIVETDFFRELQAKAAQMRSRRSRKKAADIPDQADN